MISEMYLRHYIENNPQEVKGLFLCFFRHLSETEKQELVKGFLGKELFETLQWCVECRKSHLDLAKIIENDNNNELKDSPDDVFDSDDKGF